MDDDEKRRAENFKFSLWELGASAELCTTLIDEAVALIQGGDTGTALERLSSLREALHTVRDASRTAAGHIVISTA